MSRQQIRGGSGCGTGLLRIVVREIENIDTPIDAANVGSLQDDLQQRTVFLDIVAID